MAITLSSLFMHNIGELRLEHTAKRIRAIHGGQTVVDSSAAVLVWEPKRVVPSYAVPEEDIATVVRPVEVAGDDSHSFDRAPVWDPRVPFAVRLTAGHRVQLEVGGGATIDGFVADDPDLAGYVILDFDGFDTWLEEDDEIISHPHSPFSRIDIRETSKRLRLTLDGIVVAESSRARILFETGLPARYYFPRGDVVAELKPSKTVTTCAYKGVATYYSLDGEGANLADLAWSYVNPLIDGEPIRDYVCFFDEKLDLSIDGTARPRPQTPWS